MHTGGQAIGATAHPRGGHLPHRGGSGGRRLVAAVVAEADIRLRGDANAATNDPPPIDPELKTRTRGAAGGVHRALVLVAKSAQGCAPGFTELPFLLGIEGAKAYEAFRLQKHEVDGPAPRPGSSHMGPGVLKVRKAISIS